MQIRSACALVALSMGCMNGAAQAQDGATHASWADHLSVGMFVDAHAALLSDDNDTRTIPSHRAYVRRDGFQLSFAGIDASYAGDAFGATISLRFGPSVPVFYAADMGPLGLGSITQAYATWKPVEGLTLDLGQFWTPFGAEVAESFRNKNYTRGALYYAFQPFWHTGLRASYAVSERLALTGLVVNGVNSAFEGNRSPSLGLQLVTTPVDALSLSVGYLGALHPRDGDEGPLDVDGDGVADVENKFDHFFDLVATLSFGDFSLTANADVDLYRLKGQKNAGHYLGVSLAPGYAFTNWFGVAVRAEYLRDGDNAVLAMPGTNDASSLVTLTGTLDFKPVPNRGAVILRPEFRYELASEDEFRDDAGDPTDRFWTLVLGAVVTSM